jgi:type I restriction enzyme S subunit
VNKVYLTETKKFKEAQIGSYTAFINGDIIFAKVTPCMENGKIAIVHNLKNGIGYGSSEFHVLRCSDELLNKYLFYYVVQDRFRNEAQYAMTGAVGLRRVPKRFIETHTIPVPTLLEQQQIVQELESRLSVCEYLEETITNSLKQAEALRQSILKKAFEGRLFLEKGSAGRLDNHGSNNRLKTFI